MNDRDADAGHAKGGDEAERATGQKREDDRDRAGHRQIGDVHIVGLSREVGEHDRRGVGDRGDGKVNLGGEDDEGEADSNDRRHRHLLKDILQIADRGERRARDAEEADERDQGYERRDVAQLIAQEIAQPKGACGSDLGALHIHLKT